MDPTTETRAALSDYLAAERTFLAWIRTGLALMGFGFVVARFGLFLQEFQSLQRTQQVSSTGLSLWFGTALIVAGVLVNLGSAWRHMRLVRELDRGETSGSRAVGQAVATAVFLALVGIAMAIYLVSVRNSASGDSGNVHSRTIEEGAMAAEASTALSNGIVRKPSNHSVDDTVGKLKGILEAKGVMLFALVDHSGEAAKVGLKMPNTKLLIFGNPKGGTPLMLAAPSVAIDLPLKILVAEDSQAKVWLSYNSAEYLQTRHGFPADLIANISVVETLAIKAGE